MTALVPSLSRSLAERFNVFTVMHHGTHEKQLSNVFAWLFDAEGTHGLGDAFQRIFVQQVNDGLRDPARFPATGYRVAQEVDTCGHVACAHKTPGRQEAGKDIADIVLAGERARIVVENYWTSDGHGHCHQCYLDFGRSGVDDAVVVLLCGRREPWRQDSGWEDAAVVTYAELITALRDYLDRDSRWRVAHPDQAFFIQQMAEQFVEEVRPVSTDESIDFIAALCATGESDRYGFRPQERAAAEFGDEVAQHAKHQFEEGRRTLGEIKRALKWYAEHVLVGQVNATAPAHPIVGVKANYQGMWEFCIVLERGEAAPMIYLEFGPTAVAEYKVCTGDIATPDYSTVFVTRQAPEGSGIDRNVATTVSLADVLTGIAADDVRLRDAVLHAIGSR